jgi:hypothetical protein
MYRDPTLVHSHHDRKKYILRAVWTLLVQPLTTRRLVRI